MWMCLYQYPSLNGSGKSKLLNPNSYLRSKFDGNATSFSYSSCFIWYLHRIIHHHSNLVSLVNEDMMNVNLFEIWVQLLLCSWIWSPLWPWQDQRKIDKVCIKLTLVSFTSGGSAFSFLNLFVIVFIYCFHGGLNSEWLDYLIIFICRIYFHFSFVYMQ